MKNSIKLGALALVLAVAVSSCGAKKTESTTDTTKVDSVAKMDTMKKDTTAVDTAKMKDTTKKM